jgi:hypothetical protein
VGVRPTYQPFGAARELMRCHDREVPLSGPSSTGKSMACLQKIDLTASQTPIAGRFIRQLSESVRSVGKVWESLIVNASHVLARN